MENLSKRLKELRKNKGLTQEQVAKDLKTTKVSIGRYENGSREPSIYFLKNIAEYYNVSVDYLLGKSRTNHYFNISNDKKELLDVFDKLDSISKKRIIKISKMFLDEDTNL
ncbi:TPA: helix-turn-helix transcriptional regulator [Clostridioides difficile]|uniref:helix-turn-helix domain-containing protein n=1 Tax=Clostridioides TaxID=1870884 RepID=UPI0009800EAF|nr:helix-turn-helix transcriptional regulator [Clostridioides difficile]MCC0685860.1 helix-turn-helix transcriptional regulator [Clostridioides sp. ZZV14-6345]ELX4590910.1 helix-turn-helix transcriptional regulator [Clostridioides difficile]MBH7538121.1 helix-turn-helix transcriptional regulator [Clostridioides difficile]MCA0705781.1 helix-turn-helix domain-containing protein [Clostridioides difficile]MCA0747436.1 helix-turn-helix domain-containing protein [Clostridioides difficile]